MASIQGSGAEPEEPYISREELVDDLALQKILLSSLDPTQADFAETKAAIEEEIISIKRRLNALKEKKKQAATISLRGPFAAAAARTASTQSRTQHSPKGTSLSNRMIHNPSTQTPFSGKLSPRCYPVLMMPSILEAIKDYFLAKEPLGSITTASCNIRN